MICLKCESDDFELKPAAVVEQEFRGETFHVQTPLMECRHCHWQTLADGQMQELGRRTADAYRKKHGLLTSEEIRALRLSLDMSQQEFAAFLRVGEASVKRWESWKIQDASNDELIRVKCSLAKGNQEARTFQFSQEFLFPSQQPMFVPWQDLAQVSLQNTPDSWCINAWWAQIDTASMVARLEEEVVSAPRPWEIKEAEATVQEVPFCGPVKPRNLGGRPPPETSDASRFSFPMPSENMRVSEKKTIMKKRK